MKVSIKTEEKIKVVNSDDIYGIMQRVLLRDNKLDRVKEHFWTIGLAIDNVLLFVELISIGSKNATIVTPSEVFGLALHKGAASIILVHNHPSGNMTPTEKDKDLSDRMIVSGLIVNCPVLDHLIISEKEYLSFDKIGLMNEIQKNSKLMPGFIEKAEIAKKMKQGGSTIEFISQCTGLSPSEIRILLRKSKD